MLILLLTLLIIFSGACAPIKDNPLSAQKTPKTIDTVYHETNVGIVEGVLGEPKSAVYPKWTMVLDVLCQQPFAIQVYTRPGPDRFWRTPSWYWTCFGGDDGKVYLMITGEKEAEKGDEYRIVIVK